MALSPFGHGNEPFRPRNEGTFDMDRRQSIKAVARNYAQASRGDRMPPYLRHLHHHLEEPMGGVRRRPYFQLPTINYQPAPDCADALNAATFQNLSTMHRLRFSGFDSVWTKPSTASSSSGDSKYSENFAARPARSASQDAISSTMDSLPLKRQITSSKSVLPKKSF